MKRVSGDALIAWLVVNQPAIAARVIVITGGGKDPARDAWLHAFDPTRLLRKPCSLTDLIAVIRRALPPDG